MKKIAAISAMVVLGGLGAFASVAVANEHKVIICHNTERGQHDPVPALRNEIEVAAEAVDDHVANHGDTVGRCGQVTVTVPGPTTTVTVPGHTVTVEVPGPTHTVTVEKEVPGPERVVEKQVIVPQYVNVPVFSDRIIEVPVVKTVIKRVTKIKNVPVYIRDRCIPGPKTPKPDKPPVRPREAPFTP
jgi:hypothetical protein